MVKSVIEYEEYSYSIVIVGVTRLPIDDILLGNVMSQQGYSLENNDEDIMTLTKQNSNIEINVTDSKIQINSKNLHELFLIQNEMFKIISTECNFDINKYRTCYELEGVIILPNLGNPLKNINNIISKQVNQNASKIFDQSLQTDGIRFYNGDRFDLNYSNIEITPRIGRENNAYNIRYVIRHENKENVDKFIQISESKILAFLNTLN